MIPPLCIIQARYHSTRLPGKMLLTLPGPHGEETLIARAVRLATEVFGEHVVVAIPLADNAGPLGEELRRINATVFAWDGPEWDVLGRFHACANTYRWSHDSVLVRYTPDDWRKSPDAMIASAHGFRVPVEVGAEAFTLAMLDRAVADYPCDRYRREHITHALFPVAPPPCPPGCWTVDTPEDYDAARARAVQELA